jgi:REP element-mobilizing transposase RayT
VVSETVDKTIKSTCEELEKRYEMRFLEIGADKDHVHFLIQTTPKRSASQIIRIVKSITAREVFAKHAEVKQKLWGGEFWSDGYYVSTVGKSANETVIAKYVQEQGRETEYKKMYEQQISWLE